jgi:DNA-binding NtrC family response regulator
MEPDMNGRQTLEQVLAIRPDQKTLIASGYAESSEVKKACTLGKTTLMNKPYTLQKLGECVQRALSS